nr:unnamed protein product [Callosobruchus analis]
MSHKYNIDISGPKCENRFKVLERNYKKVVDNNNRTGRARKIFEYQDEFEDMHGKKVNIRPQILLSNSQTFINSPVTQEKRASPVITNHPTSLEIPDEPQASTSGSQSHTPATNTCQDTNTGKTRKVQAKRTYKKRSDIFIEMKDDMKKYYDQKIALEKDKLALSKKKAEQKEGMLKAFKEHTKELKMFNKNHQKTSSDTSSGATVHPL